MPFQVSAIGHIGIGAACAILLSSGLRSCPSAKAASTKAVGYLAQDGAFRSRLEAIVNQTSAFECLEHFSGVRPVEAHIREAFPEAEVLIHQDPRGIAEPRAHFV